MFLKGSDRLVNCGDHPIHKKGGRSQCPNYRSTCLLSLLGKVYAKKWLGCFLAIKKLLNSAAYHYKYSGTKDH